MAKKILKNPIFFIFEKPFPTCKTPHPPPPRRPPPKIKTLHESTLLSQEVKRTDKENPIN